jgi:hypothetical protein
VAHHAENLAAHLDTIEERIAADNVSESRSVKCGEPASGCTGNW